MTGIGDSDLRRPRIGRGAAFTRRFCPQAELERHTEWSASAKPAAAHARHGPEAARALRSGRPQRASSAADGQQAPHGRRVRRVVVQLGRERLGPRDQCECTHGHACTD
jgi:hypothetical protein